MSIVRPRARGDLEFVRVAPSRFLLRDAEDNAYELGMEERFLFVQLDGISSLEDVRERYRHHFGRTLPRRDLSDFVEQLRQCGLLAHDPSSTSPPARPGIIPPAPLPLSKQDPGAGLNSRFDLAALALGWLLHPACVLPATALGVIGANILARNFGRLMDQLAMRFVVVSPYRLAALWVITVLIEISLPMALAKGMACRRFGGRVRRFGLRFYRRLVPYFECDIGDSLATIDEQGRYTLLSLGLWMRLVVGSLALIAWQAASRGSTAELLSLLLITPCVVGLLLRINVFLPFEGCALLSYALDVPRLHERALAHTDSWLLGSERREALTAEERFWFSFYGIQARIWLVVLQLLVMGGGGWLLVDHARGPGALIGAVLLVWWYHEEIARGMMSVSIVRWLVRGGGHWYIRWPIRLALLAGLVACGFIPYRHEIGGEARLIPVAEYGIRAQIAGEITELPIREGQVVEAGALIASLAGREEKMNVETTRAVLDQAKAKLDLLRSGTRPERIEIASQEVKHAKERLEYATGELQRVEGLAKDGTVSAAEIERARFDHESAMKMLAVAQEELTGLTAGPREEEIREAAAEVARAEALLAYHEGQLALKTITTPISGRIVTWNVDRRRGQYVQPGELIAVVQDNSKLQVEIAATQDAAEFIQLDQRVELRLWGLDGALLTGRVDQGAPAAATEAQLAAERVRSDRETLAQTARQPAEGEFVRVIAQLDAPPKTLMPEMTGYARIIVADGLFWEALARPILRFFRVEVWSWLP